ncbi:hypothetical protein ACA593_14470 [Lactiplantibacillus pentosus]|uniref:Capsular polysaccharide biosynthesis protein CpsC n=1 Tax=Lactiplantibacillus pentosus TaxID=1589 RepID=A0AAW8VZ65_LACPE|nr:hypothetical protein [Lactiplantibacillus pentosus]MBO9166193.1 hypothetical protein [Lactiplantibacillus pentosus]MBU7474987.1 hypothetical protein [Lactiplantibacillus pentosus]MBU7530284.1 hypothetical protein [Lactiplantibacillus pentosus]MCE6030996.1 hypothetical protein [Lactiplantibacillus pentosus]MCT3277070.1 hypothetical protein [Lactiplantibacillus pentosus]
MKFVFRFNSGMVHRLIKKYLLITVLIAILFGGLSGAATLTLKKNVYTSTGQMVQNDNNYTLIQSYKQFAASSSFTSILDKKIAASEWKKSSASHNYTIAIGNNSDSPFFSVSVASPNKHFSKYLANVAMQTLVSNLSQYLSGANVSIVSEASTGYINGYKKTLIKYVLVAAVLAFVLSWFVFIIKELFTGKVKDEDFMQDVFEISQLGTITLSEKKGGIK